MTKGLAAQLGDKGIRVVAVAPSLMETPGIEAVQQRGGDRMQEFFGDLVARLPLGRTGTPDEVARVVAFLASDAAAYVTGITVPVDGGELAV
jgi:NAD(P)-dependent dehydrogenase (short-subunit alcohol dehydrogenase family)